MVTLFMYAIENVIDSTQLCIRIRHVCLNTVVNSMQTCC